MIIVAACRGLLLGIAARGAMRAVIATGCAGSISALLMSACAAAVPSVAPPRAPSTHRDPPAYVPLPEAAPSTGGLVGIAAAGGEDQARELLVRVVSAIVARDRDTLESLLATDVLHGGSLIAGRSRTAVSGARLAEQLVAQARVTQLRPDARFEELVELASIRVEPITVVLGDAIVAPLSPGDLVVRFAVTPAGRRVLQSIAPAGQGALVVRTGEEPLVIAR